MTFTQSETICAHELNQYEGTECPKCHNGTLVRDLNHDAVDGNTLVLRCTNRDYTLDIVK